MAERSWFTALRKAFVYHWNLLFLGVVGGLAVLSGRPDVVLSLAGAAEIAYLAILSSNRRFQNLAVAVDTFPGNAGEDTPERSTTEILSTLHPADRARYQRLSDLCRKLRGLSVGAAGREALDIPDLQLQNIDRLLRLYLRLLARKNNLERFFATVNETELQRDLARSRQRLAALATEGGDPSRTEQRQAVLIDTIATIETRLGNYHAVQENHDTIVLELERLNTKIAGIAEMGIDRRGAAALGREIELVTSAVEGTERTMQEIEDFAETSFGEETPSRTGGGRRLRRGVRA